MTFFRTSLEKLVIFGIFKKNLATHQEYLATHQCVATHSLEYTDLANVRV
jgi:hypothetical protein